MKSLRSLATLCRTTALMTLLLGMTTATHADVNFHVSLDTTPLTGSLAANAPFSLLFQLIDGDGIANNTMTMENFSFSTGSAGGNIQLFGGAMGDLAGIVTLSDSDPGFIFNAFYQEFTPGNTLDFDVKATTHFAGGTPDRFSFAVVDGSGVEIPTSGMSGEFAGVDLNGPAPLLESYGGTGDYAGIGSPTLVPTATVVPEASPLALLTLALPIHALQLRKRRA